MGSNGSDEYPDGRTRARGGPPPDGAPTTNGETRPVKGVETELPDTQLPQRGRPVRKVGFIINDTIQSAIEQAHNTARFLTSRGVIVVESHSASPETSVNWTEKDELDIIFTFGGDGTVLRAARYSAPLKVPLVGINLGRVGFLTEMNPWQVQERVPLFLQGKYWLERRAMLRAELWRDGQSIGTYLALNDVVVARAALSRVVNCALTVDDHPVTTYVADGVIVATPTGSTAYSMAAGGPILHPELQSIIVTPIAPYLTVIRSLVLPDKNKIDLHIETDDEAFMTIDGQLHVAMHDSDTVSLTTAADPCLFARVQDHAYFSSTLVNRLRRAE